jgi:hypothetical protein
MMPSLQKRALSVKRNNAIRKVSALRWTKHWQNFPRAGKSAGKGRATLQAIHSKWSFAKHLTFPHLYHADTCITTNMEDIFSPYYKWAFSAMIKNYMFSDTFWYGHTWFILNSGQSSNINADNRIFKCGRLKLFGNNSNNLKLDSWRKGEKVNPRACMLPRILLWIILRCSYLHYIASDWMKMNYQRLGRNGLWPKCKYHPDISVDELRKTTV